MLGAGLNNMYEIVCGFEVSLQHILLHRTRGRFGFKKLPLLGLVLDVLLLYS